MLKSNTFCILGPAILAQPLNAYIFYQYIMLCVLFPKKIFQQIFQRELSNLMM